MKRILLPTDFSENAWNAIFYATELFKDFECEFYLLNTFHIDTYTTTNLMAPDKGNPAYKEAYDESQEALKDVVNKIADMHPNVKHSFEVLSINNFLLDAVTNVVESRSIDMIIMGTKGATGSRSVYFGSNAIDVMQKVTGCPVLVIPEQTREVKIKKVVFPASYEYAYKKKELQSLLEIVRMFDSTIHVLHIKEEDKLSEEQLKNKELLEDDLKKVKHSFHSISNMDPALGIRCFVESVNANIIALVNRKHSFFERLIKVPVLKNVGFYTKIPLLVMHH
ncbi:universal stress protein [Abyssalbus ytuae]|uniref:Universal stress protein n=1 Tax=Abyssalbus ytuae TaxID=2926907 RepID=A0A9E7CU87_9FLAO|nr:universal stress protein [Abyssalbus ytuae]UOB17922.1 universal stress protein [Abyssalbus ytuae]